MNTPSAARPPGAPRRSGHEIKRRGFRLRCVCWWAAALSGSIVHGATVVSSWTSATSGIWNSDSNWTNVPIQGGFPNNGNGGVATYDAVVNATGAFYSVNLATNITVEDLMVSSATATINHTAGRFTATGAIDLSAGKYSLNGGTIRDTAINVSGSGAFSVGANSNNMLAGVTVNGDLTLNTESAGTQIGPGTSFTTAHLAGKTSELGFAPGSIVTGSILFETIKDAATAGTRYLSMTGVPGTVTIASGSIVRMELRADGDSSRCDAIIGTGNNYFGAMTLVNQGTIASQGSDRTITVNTESFTNSGGPTPGTLSATKAGVLTISAANWSNAGNINVNAATANLSGNFNNTGNISLTDGGVGSLSGTWTNAGNISVTGGSRATFSGTWSSSSGTTTVDATSSLTLSGNFKTTDLGTLALSPGSRINVSGAWDNSGQTFTFPSTCAFAGTISGGTVNFPDGAALVVAGIGSSNLLTGVTINGDLGVGSPGAGVKIEGGTTFRTASVGAVAALGFEPGYTLTSTVTVGGALIGSGSVSMNGNAGIFTVGPTGIIHGGYANIGSGYLYGGAMTLVNQGLITSDEGLGTRGLTISATSFTNSGTLQARGFVLTIASASFTNSGTVEALAGRHINIYSDYTQTAGVTRLLGGEIGSNMIRLNGGTLEGWGGVYGTVSASGIIDPKFGSTSVGPGLQFNGDLNLGTDAELRFSLGGTAKGTQYDFLGEAGTVPLKLDGTLKLEFANGFENTVTGANTFTILTSNQNLTGAFDNVASGTRLNTADGIGSFVVTYSGQSVVLSNFVVPEPGVAALCAAAGILLLSRRSKPAMGAVWIKAR